jgi:transposase
MEVLGVSPRFRRYSPEFKERAVRMVRQLRAETGQTHGTIQRVADQVGWGVESLRTWVKQAEVDAGEQPGTTTEDAARLRVLEQEVRELRRANEIRRRWWSARATACGRSPRTTSVTASGTRASGRPTGAGSWRTEPDSVTPT